MKHTRIADLAAVKPISILTLALIAGGVLGAAHGQGVIDRDHVPSMERVDRFERRRDNIDANNMRATITNWAQTAQSGTTGDFFYEWPKNTNRIYISLTQLWIGAQVTDRNGNDIFIVDVADFRSKEGDQTVSWTLEPIRGYVNPNRSAGPGADGIAQSDEPGSWPPFWPDKLDDESDPGWSGSWNGLFGKNVFNADQEFFFKVGDDQYDRFPAYFPDSTDLSRKGLGIIAEVRALAWSQILIDDAVFFIHAIKNDGTENLPRVGFSMWLADLVGGDATDDIPFFSIIEDVAFMTDADGIGDENFGSTRVGEAAFAFLETPGNAADRIDNDGDGSTAEECEPQIGECNSPIVPGEFLIGEGITASGGVDLARGTNGIDDNGNGLVDEDSTHVPFAGEQATSVGVGYADYIDNDEDGEQGGPIVTAEMIAQSSGDRWLRWPPNPGNDATSTNSAGRPIVHLVGVDIEDLDKPFRDFIDNDDSHVAPTAAYPYLTEPGSPTVTQEIIDQAASDPYRRYRVPGTNIVLLDVGPEDLGKAYADGVDNDDDGAVDEGIDEGIDEMIDESRADFIDNDGDWNPLRNDSGLDGVSFNGDAGDGDGVPTSGAGTPFPGERNIDVTDISESDQIGITNVRIIAAFSLNLQSAGDGVLYNRFMIPGQFDIDIPAPGENDLVISSGLFPLQAGQVERISLSIQIGNTVAGQPPGTGEVLDTRDNALEAYLEDYQFAQAPITPTVTAVPGDGRVTLYWDSNAEESFDQFLDGLGRNPNDFEGYRIYRSTDPAFLDPLTITDGFGNTLLRRPIAQFDLIDGFEGFHPVDINGVKFYLGDNRRDGTEGANGLTHMFVDENVTNGITYFYAVTAYDFGSTIDNIPPTETPIRIQRRADGTIQTGPNVVEVVPAAPVAGYVGAELRELALVRGSTNSEIFYNIVDPREVRDGHRYRVTFEDTLILGTTTIPDTLTTKNFTLVDITETDTLLARSETFSDTREFPLFDDKGRPIGFDLRFVNEDFVAVNRTLTGWNREEIFPLSVEPYTAPGFKGLRNPADYRIKVVGDGEGQSIELEVRRRVTLPSRPTNIQLVRVLPDGSEVPVDYAFWDLTPVGEADQFATTPATFSAESDAGETDFVIAYESKVGDDGGEPVITWRFGLQFAVDDRVNPQQGDTAEVILRKPFLSTDAFEFVTAKPLVDTDRARVALDSVQVVPNPYVATNRFEPLNPFTTGRGPRVLKFINLPPQATVRIFTVSGRLVRTLRRDEGSNTASDGEPTVSDLMNGTLSWDLESSDNLTVAYGVYLYHVEAPGIGEKTGTFAIIK